MTTLLPPSRWLMLAAAYSAGVLVTLVIGPGEDGAYLVPLFLCGGMAVVAAWSMARWPAGVAAIASFGAVLLLMGALNRVLYLADLQLSGPRFSEWPFFTESAESAVLRAEVMAVAGTLLTFLAWTLAGGHRPRLGFLDQVVRGEKGLFLLVIYALATAAYLFERWGDAQVVESLRQMLTVIETMGLASAALLAARLRLGVGMGVLFATTLSAPLIWRALGSGMKEDIILSLLPIAMLLWWSARGYLQRIALIVGTLVFVGLMTSYVQHFRDSFWEQGRSATTAAGAARFLADTSNQQVESIVSEGAQAFLKRNNASYHRGWAVVQADDFGFEPGLIFEPMAYVFVPRVIWPEKPAIRPGWEYSGLIFGRGFTAWSGSSTAAGFYTALYLGGGLLAVVFGALFIGALVAGCTRVADRWGSDVLVFYAYAMVPFAMRMDENWPVGVISAPIALLVYSALWCLIARFIVRTLEHGDLRITRERAPS